MCARLSENRIASMPKIELHRHLSGALSSKALFNILASGGVKDLPPEEEFIRQTSMTRDPPGFHAFLDKFVYRSRYYTDPSLVREVVETVVREAAEEGIIHLELRFSADHFARRMNFDLGKTTEQIISTASAEARARGMSIVFIMTLTRHIPLERNVRLADISIRSSLNEWFAGIDIAGDEARVPLDPLKPFIREALERGKKVTVHAGEAGPAENVREAVRAGACRIGHGVRAFRCPDILSEAAAAGVTFEVCPTSNLQTGAAKDIYSLEIKKLIEEGIRITVNTDDPGVSDTDLGRELALVQETFGLEAAHMETLLLNAAEGAFVSETGKEELKGRIRRYFHPGGEDTVRNEAL